jgi:transcriptional regulator of NAD metabolism
MNEISTEYNKILDDGVSITELYIYHLIVSDDRSIGLSEKNIEDLIQKVTEARYMTDKGLE